MAKSKTLANSNAFPLFWGEPGAYDGNYGMTYRRWLVGVIAGGWAAKQYSFEDKAAAKSVISFADAIISELEKGD